MGKNVMRQTRFETDRLIIRDMTMNDCDEVAKSWGSKEVGKFMGDPYYKDGNELREVFHEGELLNSKAWTDDFYFVAIDKKTKKMIGTACTWKMENEVWGIGYTINYGSWNQGLATELIHGLESFVKEKGGRYLSSDIAKDNIASLKACYKNGFVNYREITYPKSGTEIVFDALELRKQIG